MCVVGADAYLSIQRHVDRSEEEETVNDVEEDVDGAGDKESVFVVLCVQEEEKTTPEDCIEVSR